MRNLWCLVIAIGFGLLDGAASHVDLILSSKGYLCDGKCEVSTFNYHYCYVGYNTLIGSADWQYCSPQPGHDYMGNKCESECGFHGHGYQWCWTKGSESWGYCSTMETTNSTTIDVTPKDIHGNTCLDARRTYMMDSRGTKCQTNVGMGYFSRIKGYSTMGRKCKDDCRRHKSTNYFWCQTEGGSWDYCSS